MPNRSYEKGYRHEYSARKDYGEFGRCTRAHRSGAYTGECDLKWFYDGRFWTIDCKSRANGNKRARKRLEKADILDDKDDRGDPIVTLYRWKLFELMGLKEVKK